MKAIPKRALLVTCVVILLPMFFCLALWNRLPERMPTHFDFSGTANGYSSRPFAVIGIPLFILAMHLFCAVMLRADPKKQNISEKMAQLGIALAFVGEPEAVVIDDIEDQLTMSQSEGLMTMLHRAAREQSAAIVVGVVERGLADMADAKVFLAKEGE